MIDPMTQQQRPDGSAIIQAAWAGTALFVLTAVASVLTDRMRLVGVVVALALFAIGTITFLVAYARAVNRSRLEEISVVELFFLSNGCAPKRVRRHLMGALAVQVVTAFATASARPFTAVAFGILVPMYGLGMAGLWAATHGTFQKRRQLRPKKVKQPKTTKDQ
jgi:hypothetical protein